MSENAFAQSRTFWKKEKYKNNNGRKRKITGELIGRYYEDSEGNSTAKSNEFELKRQDTDSEAYTNSN